MSTNREKIKITLINNIKEEFRKVFERYRKIVSNSNESMRNEFFDILKSQIVQSLDDSEKFSLIVEIQRGSPHSTYSSDSMNNSAYSHQTIYSNNYQNNGVQMDNGYQVDLDQSQSSIDHYGYINGQGLWHLVPRCSKTHESNSGQSSSPTLDSNRINPSPCLDDESRETEPENNIQELNLIKSLYDEISNLVEKNDDVVERLESIKIIHGNEIYQKTIKYIPMDSQNKKQPIIFQLACKTKKYETALDKLKEEDLLKLNEMNLSQTTLLNFLLFRGYSLFYDFLLYLNKRDIQPDICYVLSNNDSMINELTSFFHSNNEITNLTTEKLLVKKGILYYRNLFKELIEEKSTASKNHNFIDELITNKLLAMVLNEPINKSGSYINDLVNNYPKSESVIRSIIEKDKTVILESSFFVLLTKKSIDLFYKILILLVKELKVEKKSLSKACYRENEDGQTVVSILQGNTDRNYKKQKQFILEFIEKYIS